MVIQLLRTKLKRGINRNYVVPADVVAALGLLVAVDVLFFLTSSVMVAALSLVVLLFVPGYLLVATLFPRRGTSSGPGDILGGETLGGTLRWPPRVALSFGTSVALIPLASPVLAFAFGSLSPEVTLIGLNFLILVGAVGAMVQRNRTPKAERFRPHVRRWLTDLWEHVGVGGSVFDRVLAVTLLVVVLTAAATVGFSLLAPMQGEAYTSAALLTEQPDGSLAASSYPTEMESGTGRDLVVRVENHEGVERDYTLIGELQRVNSSDEELTVVDSEAVFRANRTVKAGTVWEASHTVEPNMTGAELRLRYYLYRGDVPTRPDAENAYRTLTLWVSVTDSTG